MTNFSEYVVKKDIGDSLFLIKQDEDLSESTTGSRYSIEVNYRSTPAEVLESYAKLALGYISAGLKQYDYHIKHVYTDKPIRILIASRAFDDGEWVVLVSWNVEHKCFIVSKGFYNKDRKTVSVQSSEKCKGENASELTKQVYNIMRGLKDKPDRHMDKYKAVPMKRGPKS